MPPPIPARDARAIFTAADDFRLAYEDLVQTGRHSETLRTVGPQNVCALFAIELYLKCILVDFGCTSVPSSHDPGILFLNMPNTAKTGVLRQWKDTLKQWEAIEPNRKPEKDFAKILASFGNGFETWRYRFEHSGATLPNEYFSHVHVTLHWFLLKRHPEWLDQDHSYFRSTFPTP